jgi:hypothetical protein
MIQKLVKMFRILLVNYFEYKIEFMGFYFYFKDTFLNVEESDLRYSYVIILLRFLPESNVLIASTNIKQCLGWRYNNT